MDAVIFNLVNSSLRCAEVLARLGAAVALALCLPAAILAADEIDPIEAAREGLGTSGELPWYDQQSDELRAVPLSAAPEPPERPTEGIEYEADGSSDRVAVSGAGIWYFIQALGGLAAALLIVLIIGLAIRTSLQRRQSSESAGESINQVETSVDRMEDLPVPLRRSQSDLLGEARRHYERGDFNEAVIYLYSYLLVELDKAQRIRLVRGKTNRQYLRELRDVPSLQNIIENTMFAFEDVFFGNHELGRGRFESLFGRLDEFHQHLEPAAA